MHIPSFHVLSRLPKDPGPGWNSCLFLRQMQPKIMGEPGHHNKVTIIWAPQSDGANRMLRAPHTRAVRGPTWGSRGVPWAPPVGSGAESRPPALYFIYTDKIWANFCPLMHKHTAAEMGKSGKIRDIKPQMGVPGERELWFFFWDTLKIWIVLENPGRMITLAAWGLLVGAIEH